MHAVRTGTDPVVKPFYHMDTDVFRWHEYQGDRTNDCAARCIAIVGNAVLGWAQFKGSDVAREMERVVWVRSPVPHPTLRKLPGWAALPWGISGYLKSEGIPARLRWLGSTEDLLRNIREDRCTIVLVGGFQDGALLPWAHAKVLYGFEPLPPPDASTHARPKHGFYFVDPGFEKGQAGLPHFPEGVFWQDEAEFRKEWGGLLRVYVEAGLRVPA